jgi:hypothetical protein
MTGNYDITWEETVDPAGINCGPEGYLVSSKKPGRRHDIRHNDIQHNDTQHNNKKMQH